ncbi:YrrS family protein [Gottfriedia acidiceleris]|uniref:YrrS family protein n=1 Tax=Gottfriedia acidiceleris TaxID=371036 RepID=A0ABY4JNB6_9BACI|nr:YrrS family protein [Gottfriedia acidiceleris]UPM55332.1 YrrS family protein [Gottfriedia acidiceleris]
MSSIEPNKRVQKLRRVRRGNYFYRILLIPLLVGIIYLGIKITLPIVNQQKIEPNTAKAKITRITQEPKQMTDIPNPYQAKYRQKVNEIIKDSINDENIIESTVKEWTPNKTRQIEPHTVHYSHMSQDFYEMEEAVSNAISLTKEDYSVWHIGQGYDQQSIKVYVATNDLSYKYVVYLHWVVKEGWLPILVQEVKELKY